MRRVFAGNISQVAELLVGTDISPHTTETLYTDAALKYSWNESRVLAASAVFPLATPLSDFSSFSKLMNQRSTALYVAVR